MRIVQASKVNRNQLLSFLKDNEQIEQTLLLGYGYVVLNEQQMIGCFQLTPIEKDVFWLNQLYIIQNEAGKLPFLLELILMFVEEQKFRVVYAHSEQPITDLLLESVSFSLRIEHQEILRDISKDKGQWWSYYVG